MNSKAKTKRSTIYVDPEVQMALARRVAVHWCIFMVVCFVFTGIVQGFIEHPSTSLAEMLSYGLKRNFIAILAGIAMMPLFIFDTMKVTNRFAGPIRRLRETLRAIANGETTAELKIRSGDYWGGLAEEFNAAMARMSTAVVVETGSKKESALEATVT